MKDKNFMEDLLEGVSKIEEAGLDDKKIEYYLNEAKELLKNKHETLDRRSTKNDTLSGIALAYVSYIFLNHYKFLFDHQIGCFSKASLGLSIFLAAIVVTLIVFAQKGRIFSEVGNYPKALMSKDQVKKSLSHQMLSEILSYQERLEENEELIQKARDQYYLKIILLFVSLVLFAIFYHQSMTVITTVISN